MTANTCFNVNRFYHYSFPLTNTISRVTPTHQPSHTNHLREKLILSPSYRALLTCFMNELGASGEQVDSFRESNLDWIFAEKFSHAIWESTQVFTNVNSLPFTVFRNKKSLGQALNIACKSATGDKIASRLLFCPSNSPTSHWEMILFPAGFSILVCKVANKGFLTWFSNFIIVPKFFWSTNKITSISIWKEVIG